MADLIDRQAALREAYPIYIDGSMFDVVQVETLIGLPTVDAVPVRHGRWIDKNGSIATCSACGDRWGVWSVMHYCPNCGSDMRDGKDGDADG